MPRQHSDQIRRYEDANQRIREAKEGLDKRLENISPRLALALERLLNIKKFFNAIVEAPMPSDNLGALYKEFEFKDEIPFIEEAGINTEVINDIGKCIYLLEHLDESWRYIPIGLSACIETYFKQVYSYLIDNGGSNSKENAIKILKKNNQGIDIEVLLSFESNKFTLGEFLSQLLWTRNFDDIESRIDGIVGNEFRFHEAIKKELKNDVLYKAELIVESEYMRAAGQTNLFESMGMSYLIPDSRPYPDPGTNPGKILSSLKSDIKSLFDLRNRLSHEAYLKVNRDDELLIQRSINFVPTYLWATDFVIEKLANDLHW